MDKNWDDVNWQEEEELVASEWNKHVTDQKDRGYDNVETVTSNYNAKYGEVILADASAGDITVTLPTAEESKLLTIKKTDSSANSVVIQTPNTETIDGEPSRSITSQYIAREFASDGENYYII